MFSCKVTKVFTFGNSRCVENIFRVTLDSKKTFVEVKLVCQLILTGTHKGS